jgi:hypothetical protein
MKKVKLTNCLWAVLLSVAMCLSAVSCEKNELTDGDKFALYYPGITDIGPSTNMDLNPTYHGAKASDFKIYQVTLDGTVYQTESFLIDEKSGQVQLRNTDALPVGKYAISISCVSGGQLYKFPDLITVNMMRPVPGGIVVEPAMIQIALAQVTDMNSLEELPTAQITTEGEHISIENYYISKVTCDGAVVEDWTGLFEVNSQGKVSVLKNQNFPAGVYVLDFKLTTMVVGKDSEEGVFVNALTVDVTSPPVSLAYTPAVGKVEAGKAYSSTVPAFVGSLTDVEYSIKSVIPETAPVSIDAKTGVLSIPDGHALSIGETVMVSVSVKNAYGKKDFDQVMQIDVVAFIAEITKLEYNDSTVWHNTKFALAPTETDGDEKTYSFVDLPEALAALAIDPANGTISAKKGNGIEVGEYTLKVKVENPKGSKTKDIRFSVIENPYFFTYVRWGNNLGLTPAEKYASQHRVSTTDPYEFPVLATDVKEGVEVVYEIKGGSNTACATIDASTGKITTDPSYASDKMENFRAHFFFVVATTGKGTSGEISVKTPVFLDFNCPRKEDGYQIKYTPFVFQCNPKTGGTSAVPEITKADGTALTADELAKITMDFRRSFNYWNLDGPSSHTNGAPNDAKDNFLSSIWVDYYAAINVAYNKGSRDPISAYGRTAHLAKSPGYVKPGELSLYIAPEKWKTSDGYADGIFTAQITFADTGADPQGAGNPYRLFPLFVWFDTEF